MMQCSHFTQLILFRTSSGKWLLPWGTNANQWLLKLRNFYSPRVWLWALTLSHTHLCRTWVLRVIVSPCWGLINVFIKMLLI